MDIRLSPIAQVYKPKELVISIKTPQEELFIRHFMQKVLELAAEFTGVEAEFAKNILSTVAKEPKEHE